MVRSVIRSYKQKRLSEQQQMNGCTFRICLPYREIWIILLEISQYEDLRLITCYGYLNEQKKLRLSKD